VRMGWFNSEGVVKWAYFQKKVEYSFKDKYWLLKIQFYRHKT